MLGDAKGARDAEIGLRAAESEVRDKIENTTIRCEVAAAQAYAADVVAARQSLLEARKVAGKIGESRKKILWLRLIAEAQVRAGDSLAARQTAAEAMAAARAGGTDDRASSAAAIARAQADAGDIAGATLTAQLITDEDVAQSGLARYDRAIAYGSIATAQAATGDVSGAKATMAEIRADEVAELSVTRVVGDAWAWIAAAQAKSGGTREASRTVTRIRDQYSRAYAHLRIAAARAATGDRVEARQNLAEAGALVGRAIYQEDSEAICVGIAQISAQLGDMAQAKATADCLRSPRSQARAYDTIVDAQIKAGDLAGARQTVKEVSMRLGVYKKELAAPEDWVAACACIVSAMAASGEAAGACDLTGRMRAAASAVEGSACRARAYAEIAEAQLRIGDVIGARKSLGDAAAAMPRITNAPSQMLTCVKIAALYTKACGAACSIQYVDVATDDPALRCRYFAAVAAEFSARSGRILLFR
jgi:hypothetical protein